MIPPSMATKALDVLGTFTAERPRLNLSEVSRSTGIPLTTVHRLLSDLTAWGALEREPDGRYCIGLRLWELAALSPRGLPLREAALPFMEDLYEATHENVQLAVREGLEVVYIERLTGRDSVRVLTRVGGRFALHATGVGLVLLAHAPVDVQEEILGSRLERWTSKTIVDPRTLRAQLAEIRRSGYAISDRQVTMDAISVACPVHDADGSVVAALSLVVRVGETPPNTLVPAIRAASRGISRTLGAQLPSPTIPEPQG